MVLVGGVDFLDKTVMSFVRLAEGTMLDEMMEVSAHIPPPLAPTTDPNHPVTPITPGTITRSVPLPRNGSQPRHHRLQRSG